MLKHINCILRGVLLSSINIWQRRYINEIYERDEGSVCMVLFFTADILLLIGGRIGYNVVKDMRYKAEKE